MLTQAYSNITKRNIQNIDQGFQTILSFVKFAIPKMNTDMKVMISIATNAKRNIA